MKKKLIESGFSLASIAKDLNLSHQGLYSRLDASDVKVSFVIELCEVTGLDIAYFLSEHVTLENKKIIDELAARAKVIEDQNEEINHLKNTLSRIKSIVDNY